MRCILHIGCEKTGTTSIQKFALENRPFLKSKSISMLHSAGCPNATALAISSMNFSRKDHNTNKLGISDDIEKRSKWCALKTDKIVDEIASITDRYSTVLISAEYLSSKLHTVEEVTRVKDVLYRGGIDEISIVVYLRRQLEFAVSRQSTAIKSAIAASGTVDLDQVISLRTNSSLYDYEGLLDRWEAVFGKDNITVRVFDKKELLDGDINRDFYTKFCGIEIENQERKGLLRENRSLSALAQACLARLISHLDNSKLGENSKANIIKYATDYLDKHHSGEPYLPTKTMCMEFQSNFDDSNRRVAERWLDREVLFPGGFDRYPETSQVISDGDPRLFGIVSDMMADILSDRS